MKRRGFLAAVFCAVVLLPLTVAAQNWRDPGQHFFQPLLGDLTVELKQAAQEGKKGLLLVFEMDECPFCERLHRTTLREVVVQDYYRQNFSVFKIDLRGGTPLTGFDGREGTESSFATQQKVRATPTSVFYDLSGKEVARFPGTPRDRQEFLQWGDYVARGKYHSMSFVEFRRTAKTSSQ